MRQTRQYCASAPWIPLGITGWLLFIFALIFIENAAWAGSSDTNSPTRWLSLVQLKQKWTNIPLDAIQRAADAGDLTAEHYLGYCYCEGFRFKENPALGMEYYERAGKAGYMPSWNNLGLLYQNGRIVPQDFAKAISYYRLAADAGLAQAQDNLGIVYRDGIGVNPDAQEALKWFQLAAAQGHTSAMLDIYNLYANGSVAGSDETQGLKWFEKAAEAGDPYVECLLGMRYEGRRWRESGGRLVQLLPSDMEEAVKWYRLSATQGWAGGQYRLGLCYIDGNGVEQDEEKGLELIRQAADQDHAYAECDLAGLYAKGIGEPRNEQDRPIALLKRVVKSDRQEDYQKVREAYDSLVFRFDYGVGTDRDPFAAVQWYCRAAIAGIEGYTLADKIDPSNRSPVYRSFTGGLGRKLLELLLTKPSDRVWTALREYLTAAVSTNHAGLISIGQRYLDGRGVPRSAARAWLWFSLASQCGVQGASSKVSAAEGLMTPRELVDAKQQLPEMVQEFNSVAVLVQRAQRQA